MRNVWGFEGRVAIVTGDSLHTEDVSDEQWERVHDPARGAWPSRP